MHAFLLATGYSYLGLASNFVFAPNSIPLAVDIMKLVHNVFFTLKDPSAANITSLTKACHHYLTGHPGAVYFAAGPLCEELDRPVNDRSFHVALCVVFASKEDHDVYQLAPRHLDFIQNCRDLWAGVRVFDSWTE